MKSFEIIKKWLNSASTNSCFKRTNFILAKCDSRCSTRLCSRICFFFLIYRNVLPNEITSTCKIFADDTSLFSKIENKSYSNFHLDKDLETVSKWAFQSKMLFSLDPIKQAIEFCFSHKGGKVVYPPLMFNNNDVRSVSSQKHLWLVLASKLRFNEYLNNKIKKYNKSMDIMKEIFLILSRNSF